MAKTGLIVTDDRVVPIAYVEGAVGTEFDVDWAEAGMGRCQQWCGIGDGKS